MIEKTPFLILAGGLGTRLRSVFSSGPKCLVPIDGIPFIQILLSLLSRHGAQRIILSLGYQAEQIKAVFQNGYQGLEISFSEENPSMLLGTGGAIKKAQSYIPERTFILNGDTYFDIDYNCLLHEHLEKKSLLSMALAQSTEKDSVGNVLLDAETHKISAFSEKDPSVQTTWVNGGVYLAEKRLLNFIPNGRTCSFEREVLPSLLQQNEKIGGVPLDGRFYDVGTPQGLSKFTEFYRAKYG
jgi:NDP-sugar pyrophosphorylase family protein